MTGGEAQIQDIQPYYDVEFNSGGLEEGGAGEDRILELKELARIDFSRSAKTVSVQPKKSVHRHFHIHRGGCFLKFIFPVLWWTCSSAIRPTASSTSVRSLPSSCRATALAAASTPEEETPPPWLGNLNLKETYYNQFTYSTKFAGVS